MTRAALLLAFAFPISAAPPDPWIRLTSPNFELFTTAGERNGRDLIRYLEQVRGFFTQAFGSRLPGAKPARIIAFRSEKEYRPYRPSQSATAFYQSGAEHDFIVMESAAREYYDVAIHEFTHLMIHQSPQAVPVWLNEGTAELYSNLQPTGSKIVVGNGRYGPGRTVIQYPRQARPGPRTVRAPDAPVSQPLGSGRRLRALEFARAKK
jgi:hypothetical protein